MMTGIYREMSGMWNMVDAFRTAVAIIIHSLMDMQY